MMMMVVDGDVVVADDDVVVDDDDGDDAVAYVPPMLPEFWLLNELDVCKPPLQTYASPRA